MNAILIFRDLRQRTVKVMLLSVLIAVSSVATISLFSEHLQHTLLSSANTFLAADRQLNSRSSAPIPSEWIAHAQSKGLNTSLVAEFSTMVASDSGFHLVAVKAVDDHYPLRGEIDWQADLDSPRQSLNHGPARGEVWLNPRLMRMLQVSLADQVEIGLASFKVTGLLVREPDARMNVSALAPRLMMHLDDVPATEVIQPGSRIRHQALFAGAESALVDLQHWLEPHIADAFRWVDVRQTESLGQALDRAEAFLLLGSSLAVLLAAVAIAVSSREYARSQRDVVALYKTFGMTGWKLQKHYLIRLGLWGVCTVILGLLLAIPAAMILASMAARFMEQSLQFYWSLSSTWPAVLTAAVVLFAFAWPPISRLRNVPAMRVFRSGNQSNISASAIETGLAMLAVFGLIWLYTGDALLVLALVSGLFLLLLLLAAASAVLLRLLSALSINRQSWKMAVIRLRRHRTASLVQLTVFAMTLMLASTLILTRTALVSDWQAQLPEAAANHFLLNIPTDSVESVDAFLTEHDIEKNPLYPIVRGRLIAINGTRANEWIVNLEQVSELNRELSLTASNVLPEDNKIQAGQWFTLQQRRGVSVEQSIAETLGLQIGDELQFSIGADLISEPVTSIRSVQWDSMRPNFFFIFPDDGALTDLPATWLTSFYLADKDKWLLNDFVRQFPTIAILEIDHIIERIQTIISQVSQAVEVILLMILLAALAVMFSVVSATLAERQREGALIRTLGGTNRLMNQSIMLEFAMIGFFAGLAGVMAAELAVWGLQYRLFEGQFQLHWPLIVTVPFVSSVLIAAFGKWQLKPVLRVSPMLLLRRLE